MFEPVDAPLPVPSPRSLLSVAQLTGRIVEGSLSTTAGDTVDDQSPGAPAGRAGVARWANDGVTYAPEACGQIEDDLTLCEADDNFTDPAGALTTQPAVVTEDAIRFRAGATSSTADGRTADLAQERALRMLGLWQHEAVARSFWNDQLRADARIISAAAEKVIDGLANLEEAMAGLSNDADTDIECGAGQRAMIHVAPRTLTILNALDLVRFEGGLALTAMDSVVVSGPGYLGSGPAGQSGESTTAQWIYGTGFVDVRLSPVSVTRTLDRQDNDWVVWAARAAAVTTGACCVAAAKLDLTDRA